MSTTVWSTDPATDKSVERRSLRQLHWSVLGLSLLVIGLALAMSAVNDRQVALPWLERYPLPDVCQSRRLLHIDCPACGLTRSFIHFFHGRWDASFRMHRFGWLAALLTVLQIPYRLAALLTPTGLPLGTTFPKSLTIGLVGLLLANWLLKMVGV